MISELDLIVRGGTVMTPEGPRRTDVGIRAGRIAELGDLSAAVGETVDADGLLVLPGAVDEHVHPTYRDPPGQTSLVGLHGGVTTTIHFAYAHPGESLLEEVNRLREEADGEALSDFSIHGGMFDAATQVEEIPAVVATGVRSFKVFLAYAAQGWMTTDADLVAVMRKVREHEGLLLVHCENGPAIDALERDAEAGLLEGSEAGLIGRTRPPLLEAEAVNRVATLAQMFGARLLVVHVTSRRALEAVAEVRRGGAELVAETCPQYLALTEDALLSRGALAKIGPPLRTDDDRDALWEGLRTGQIQTIGSDHVPKKGPEDADTPLLEAGFGAPSIETMLPVLYHLGVATGRISLERFVEITSENPARAFGLYPQKGAIAVGSDADLVLWDPEGRRTLGAEHEHTLAGYSLYEGWEVAGDIRAVIVGGVLAIEDHEATGRRTPGSGRFLPTGPFSALTGDRDRASVQAVEAAAR